MYVHGIRALFRFEGYVVQKITMSSEIVQVNLRRDGRRTLRCPACGVRSMDYLFLKLRQESLESDQRK